MALANYTDLQAATASWLDRPDLTANIVDFISLAESTLNGHLKARSMELRTNLSTVAGNAYVTLPTDVLETRRLINTTTVPNNALKYVTPDQITKDYPYGTTGTPYVFTIISGAVQLAPIPDAVYVLEIAYDQKLPPLASNATNWLMTAYPNVYLFATLVQAFTFIMDFEKAAMYQKMLTADVEAVNTTDWYTGSTMMVRTG